MCMVYCSYSVLSYSNPASVDSNQQIIIDLFVNEDLCYWFWFFFLFIFHCSYSSCYLLVNLSRNVKVICEYVLIIACFRCCVVCLFSINSSIFRSSVTYVFILRYVLSAFLVEYILSNFMIWYNIASGSSIGD